MRADSEFYGHPDPSPENGPVDPAAKPSRRTFIAEYRNKIIDDYSQASHGQKSAVLRREGLYQSQLREWTQARDAAGSDTRKSRSHRANSETATRRENERLARENARLTAQLTQMAAALEIIGKTTRALGVDLHEHGHAAVAEEALNTTMAELTDAAVPVTRPCALLGLSRASHHRRRRPPMIGPVRPRQPAGNGQALTDAERAEVLTDIDTDDYADLAICPTDLTTGFGA